MIRLLVIVAVASSLALASTASAQDAADWSANNAAVATFDPEASVAPVSVVEGPGIKVGEGTVLHPVFGALTGFVSNTFYTSTDPRPAGVLRLLAQISTGSLSPQRLVPANAADETNADAVNAGSLRYRADLRASYDVMLSGNDAVAGTGGLGIGASLHGLVNPDGKLSVGFDEDFTRLIRATNFESTVNTNRDINNLRLSLLYHPQGRSLSGALYYANTIDVFERSQQQFADRIIHQIGVRPMWQFLPVTQFYLDVSESFTSGLGSSSSMKVSSAPLVAKAGIATLITLKTTVNFEAGYTNGFYSSGPSFSAPLVNLQVAHRYSPLGRVAVGYSLEYQDSINANFYRDHVLRGWINQLFPPINVMVQPELHLRQYNGIIAGVNGPPTRDDVIVSIVAGANYNVRNWLAATLGYRFTTVQTDFRYTVNAVTDDPSYARHELLAGVRAAF
jgi:hypothetical protein